MTTVWTIAAAINLISIGIVVVKEYKNNNHVNYLGLVHMSIFSCLLGPAFTALIVLYQYAVRMS